MIMAAGLDEREPFSENGADGSRIMPQDRETAAPFRPIQRECADDDMATGPHGLRHATCVSQAIGSFSEKMKRRAVVPQIIGFRWLPGGYVGGDPRFAGLDQSRALAAASALSERSRTVRA